MTKPKFAKTLDGVPHFRLSFARARLYDKMAALIADSADDEYEVREAPKIAKKWADWAAKQRGFAVKEVERWQASLVIAKQNGDEIPEEWEVE